MNPEFNKQENIRYITGQATVDQMGRVTIPSEIRKKLEIRVGTVVSFDFMGDNTYRLRVAKRNIICPICGAVVEEDAPDINGVKICKHCLAGLRTAEEKSEKGT